MSDSASGGGARLHQNFVDSVQRSLELSAESGAVVSMDPVAVIEVADQLEPADAVSDRGNALSPSRVPLHGPVTAGGSGGGGGGVNSGDGYADSEAVVPYSDKLSSPVSLTKQRSAADALAANRLPIAITWQDVKVTVDIPAPSFFEKRRLKKKAAQAASSSKTTPTDAVVPAAVASTKVILDGVSGYCQPGQLLAIMGSSGAGKTSLLNLLAGRFNKYGGEVLLNGRPATASIKQHSAFVQQQDLYFKELTVREHLQFQARLRLGDSSTAQEREERIEAILGELGLLDVRDTRIGEVGEGGISGGERRRLSFATEILSNPSLIFLDEPTSGLDSFLAESVIGTLKQMALNGRTIVCTIHQPSSEVYAMFDRVCYLAKGRVAYFGTRNNALRYFSSMLNMDCPVHSNPSDFIIKQLSVIPSRQDESRAQISHILHTWDSSEEKQKVDGELHHIAAQSVRAADPATELELQQGGGKAVGRYSSSFITQTRGLLWRSGLAISRDKMLTKARAGQTIVLSIVIGLIFLRLGNGQTDVQNRQGAIFLIIMNQSMGALFGILNAFAAEMPIYQREHRASLYSSHAYYIARSVAELPTQIIWPFLFVTIVYWMIGLNDNGSRYIEFALGLILTSNAAMSLGYALAIGAPSVQVALAMGMPIILPFILFGGLFINIDSIPKYFYWLSYLSFAKYGFELLSVIVWDGVDHIDCGSPPCSVTSGAAVLSQYGFSSSHVGEDIGVLIGLIVFFRFIAYLFLLRRSSSQL